jgi:hypothetical protein
MLRYFYKGALHGLILGMLGCGLVAAGLYGPFRPEEGTPGSSKATVDDSAHRHAQKVFPVVSATAP